MTNELEHINRVASLSQREMQFVIEYMKDENQTQAAIRAGYSSNGAATQGGRLLKRPDIQAELAYRKEQLIKPHTDRYSVTREKLIRELATIAYGNVADFIAFDADGQPHYDFSEATRDQLASLDAIQIDEYNEGRGEERRSIKRIKISTRDKLNAIKQLTELCGLAAPKKVEVSGPGGGAIPIAHAHVIMARDMTPEQRDDLEKVCCRSRARPKSNAWCWKRLARARP
jgi:phage terminase small subunit